MPASLIVQVSSRSTFKQEQGMEIWQGNGTAGGHAW